MVGNIYFHREHVVHWTKMAANHFGHTLGAKYSCLIWWQIYSLIFMQHTHWILSAISWSLSLLSLFNLFTVSIKHFMLILIWIFLPLCFILPWRSASEVLKVLHILSDNYKIYWYSYTACKQNSDYTVLLYTCSPNIFRIVVKIAQNSSRWLPFTTKIHSKKFHDRYCTNPFFFLEKTCLFALVTCWLFLVW